MDIKEILGITEMYELNKKLEQILPDKQAREVYFNSITQSGVDLSRDFIRDIYQEEAAQRKQLKQDYTPDCLCDLFYALADNPTSILDMCAGTGSLTISYIAHGVKDVVCIELSQTVFPVLMLNIAIRNVSGYLIRQDITTREILAVYRLTAGDKYSDIERVIECELSATQSIISNPPYSLAWSGEGDNRCEGYGVPPKSKADYLFILDIISRLEDSGQAFVLLPHGVLFRGQAEGEIRQKLLENGYIHGIIGLPKDMFLNTSIPTVMLCLSKTPQSGVYVMDATSYAVKEGKTNKLSESAISEIVRNYKERKDVPKVGRMVGIEEIKNNGYNLNIPRYIDTSDPEILPDLKDLVGDIMQTDAEIRQTEQELAGMMKNLVGENYQNDIAEVLKLWN